MADAERIVAERDRRNEETLAAARGQKKGPAAPETPEVAEPLDIGVSRGTRPAPQTEPVADVREVIAQAEAEVETAPTEAQKEAGNVSKRATSGFTAWTYPLRTRAVRSARVSARTASHGLSRCRRAYGYVRRTEGADGEQVDVYVGPEPESDQIFVVDQVDADTRIFDEHKIMLGYRSKEPAIADYEAAFDDGRGSERLGAVTPMSVPSFRNWLATGDTKKPVNKTAALPTLPAQSAEPETSAAPAVAPMDEPVADEVSEPAPIMRSDGQPFSTEKGAAMAARFRKMDAEPVEVEGGWGLRAVDEPAPISDPLAAGPPQATKLGKGKSPAEPDKGPAPSKRPGAGDPRRPRPDSPATNITADNAALTPSAGAKR